MKNLVVAILLAVLIVFCFGSLVEHVLDFNIHMGDQILSPLWSLVLAASIGVALVLLGFVIAVSVFGVIALVIAAIFIGLIVAGISAFWPAILLLLIVFWLVREKKPEYNH